VFIQVGHGKQVSRSAGSGAEMEGSSPFRSIPSPEYIHIGFLIFFKDFGNLTEIFRFYVDKMNPGFIPGTIHFPPGFV
jgi:hypothetical protein